MARTCWTWVACLGLAAPCAVGQHKTFQDARNQIEGRTHVQSLGDEVEPLYLPSAEDLAGVAIDPLLDECVQRLGDPSYAMREDATTRLMSEAFDNDQLYAVLARRELTAEQRHRVLSVVRDRLLSTPRGAVGIKVDRRFLPDRIVVEELLPDLPARSVLNVGDEITHLHGRPLSSWNEFVEDVQSRMPGSRVSVTVKRLVSGGRPDRHEVDVEGPKYETLVVDMELGSAEKLRDPVTGRPQIGGPVMNNRLRQADEAASRYGPRPRQLHIDH